MAFGLLFWASLALAIGFLLWAIYYITLPNKDVWSWVFLVLAIILVILNGYYAFRIASLPV